MPTKTSMTKPRLEVQLSRKKVRTDVKRRARMPKRVWPRIVRVDLEIGDFVDIGKSWLAVLGFDKFGTATLIPNKGPKARILSEGIETEMVPGVWITRVADRKALKLTLKFETTKCISIKRRREPQLQPLAEAVRHMQAAHFARVIMARQHKTSTVGRTTTSGGDTRT
jgi:hypothetical protein